MNKFNPISVIAVFSFLLMGFVLAYGTNTFIALPSGAAQGDVLYYGGSTWDRLAAGTSGQLLTTQGAAANPAWAFENTIAGTRAGTVNTAYQPSTTRDVLVCASVEVSTGVGGNGKVEAMSDSANPPTTVRGTLQVATASTVVTGQLCLVVQAGHYYRLTTTDVAGTPTYAVVGNIMEVAF